MKSLAILSLFFLTVIPVQSQSLNYEQLEKDSVFKEHLTFLLNPQKSISVEENSDRLKMTDYWTNKSFNPYKDTKVTFPFKITFRDTTFASPVKRRKVVTSRYGWRWGKPHRGIDIDLVTGDKVMAMLDGKVRYVRYVLGHGQTVVIRHENGLETIYSHLSRPLVKPNQAVKKGEVIGKGGRTGNTRGSHLHLTISYKGVFINPEYFFEFTEDNKIRAKEFWVTKKWATPYLHNSRRQSNIAVCETYDAAIQSEKNQRKVYTVQRGDTLSKISLKYNVSISSLCQTNNIRKNSLLKVGQKLIVTR